MDMVVVVARLLGASFILRPPTIVEGRGPARRRLKKIFLAGNRGSLRPSARKGAEERLEPHARGS